MSDKYRRNGTPYPEGHEGLLLWARDMENLDLRIVRQDRSLYGEKLSTVWLGLDHSFGFGPPLIFETMAFGIFGHADNFQQRYSTEAQALRGHARAKKQMLLPPFLRRFFFEDWQ